MTEMGTVVQEGMDGMRDVVVVTWFPMVPNGKEEEGDGTGWGRQMDSLPSLEEMHQTMVSRLAERSCRMERVADEERGTREYGD